MVQLGYSQIALPLNTSTCRRSRLLPHEPHHACSLWRRCGCRSLCVTKWRRVCGNQARQVTPVGGRQLAMHKPSYRRFRTLLLQQHWKVWRKDAQGFPKAAQPMSLRDTGAICFARLFLRHACWMDITRNQQNLPWEFHAMIPPPTLKHMGLFPTILLDSYGKFFKSKITL